MEISRSRHITFTQWLIMLAVTTVLTACGGGGGGTSTPANVSPTVSAGADFSADEQSQVTLSATASDSDGSISSYAWSQVSGTTVALSSTNTSTAGFVAPSVSAAVTLTFRITVTDNGGASSWDTVAVSVQPVAGLNDLPTANAGPDAFSLVSATVTLNGSASSDPDGSIATYSWSQISGPAVGLTGANTVSPSFVAPNVGLDTNFTFGLVVTDNEGGVSPTDQVVITVGQAPATITLTGKITFDLVPHNAATDGLNYNNIQITPAPRIRVQAINASNNTTVLGTADTDANGNYTMTVPSLTNMYVRARAQMVKSGSPAWNFTVVDNAGARDSGAPKPVYVMDGSSFDSGVNALAVDLHADSGWGGSSYTSERVAAPFSILYAVDMAIDLVLQADPIAVFDPLVLNWSPENTVASAEIGTSFYDGQEIYLLGEAGRDTEEYDHAVIVHEWGHYFEEVFSRSDSIGGSHMGGDVLDARVAFGEGWGNAVQAMARGNTVYFDSSGSTQNTGFSFDVEDNCGSVSFNGPRGWFNECSVQSLLLDIFDPVKTSETSGDNVNLGFGPIYDVLVADQRTTQTLTTLHSFSKYLRDLNAGSAAGIDGLLNYHQVVSGASLDKWGTNETNAASSRTDGLDASVRNSILPIYKVGLPVGTPVNLCVDVDPDEGDYNKLGNRQFIRFTVPTTGNYQITSSTTDSPAGSTPDPDMILWNQGATHYAFDAPNPVEEFCGTGQTFDFGSCSGGYLPLQTGVDYVLEVMDDNNLSYDLDSTKIGVYCMDIELTSAP
jgi:hypothetical protein